MPANKTSLDQQQSSRFWLMYPAKLIQQPLLWQLAKKFDVVTNVRHAQALNRAARSLREALHAVTSGGMAEFVAVDLRDAADALGEITGAITSDEILNRIFSEFCIGK